MAAGDPPNVDGTGGPAGGEARQVITAIREIARSLNAQTQVLVGTVTSIFGRVGAVVAEAGDYTAALVTNVPAGGIAAVTVQAAINELDTDKLNSSAVLATAVALTDPGADRILFWDESGNIIDWLTVSTGLAITGTNLTLSMLGIQNLADPNADRIMFWDDSAGFVDWLTVGNGLSITTTTLSRATTVVSIASGSLPAAATLDITSISAIYSYLILMLTGASSGTATRHILIQVSTNNGSSFDTTVANYIGGATDASIGPTLGDVAAATTLNMTMMIAGYQGNMFAQVLSSTRDSAGTGATGNRGYVGSTSAINALRILWNGSGNFDAGTYNLYGVL